MRRYLFNHFTHYIPASTPLTDGSARRLSETGVAAAGFERSLFSGGDARGAASRHEGDRRIFVRFRLSSSLI